mgnify:CR=1 FL=1|tara:strand:- start:59 stop:337 length:279 start_codon:yes stop_codon:yes gene_type:complete
MGELAQLDGLIKKLEDDKNSKNETINELQLEIDGLTKQQEALALEITKKDALLETERKGLALLEDTINETSVGYKKILESTRALLEIVSTKQ